MSLRARLANQQDGDRFPETVAQWRLQLRTEVKNSSALPTSVFHARDAQLEAMLAASTEARGAAAHAAATTGIQWMLTNMSSTGGKALAVQAASGAMNTPVTVLPDNRNVYRFDPDGKFAGAPATTLPAVGTSNADWTAFDQGHYALLAGIDPLDQKRSVLIRAIGDIRG